MVCDFPVESLAAFKAGPGFNAFLIFAAEDACVIMEILEILGRSMMGKKVQLGDVWSA